MRSDEEILQLSISSLTSAEGERCESVLSQQSDLADSFVVVEAIRECTDTNTLVLNLNEQLSIVSNTIRDVTDSYALGPKSLKEARRDKAKLEVRRVASNQLSLGACRKQHNSSLPSKRSKRHRDRLPTRTPSHNSKLYDREFSL